MPVPAVVRWIGGKPDFRQMDERKYIHHYKHRLCAVCGTKLGLSCYWVAGGKSRESHYFTDGPMHLECAELSIRSCPFLNNTKPSFRGDDLKAMPGQNAESRPEHMYLMRGITSAMELHELGPSTVALWAGKQLAAIREF
jgi:hypothetical protein